MNRYQFTPQAAVCTIPRATLCKLSVSFTAAGTYWRFLARLSHEPARYPSDSRTSPNWMGHAATVAMSKAKLF